MAQFNVRTPWQAYIQLRMQYYEKMFASPETIIANQWPHNIDLLKEARSIHCKIGLATMSSCRQVNRVLDALKLADSFDFVASSDDIENGKPDPEIYLLAAQELDIAPAEYLVIEDSVSGVQAAAAGMHCIAVATSFTLKSIQNAQLLEKQWVVKQPAQLMTSVHKMLKAQEDIIHM